MKIALFTGTAYRHIYYANEILANHEVVLHVRMLRNNQITKEEVNFVYSHYYKGLATLY